MTWQDFRPAFVTPAFGRFDLSAVVFDQRAAAIDELRAFGIDARCYVVADDENLELARERGFFTVERANDWLGARFNDGCEAAVLDGATHIVPIGSDSWVDPRLAMLVDPAFPWVTTGTFYAVLDEFGERLALLRFPDPWGIGPHVVPVSLLEPPYRPWEEDIVSGCDASLLSGLEHRRGWDGGPGFARVELPWDPELGHVGFRTTGRQLTPFDSITPSLEGTKLLEGEEAWARLEAVYPAHAPAARALYAARTAA